MKTLNGEIARTLPAVVPAAAIVVGSFAGIEWLRTVGCLALGAFVVLAVLNGRIRRPKEAASPGITVAVLGVAAFLFVAPLLPHTSLDFMLVPLLVGCVAAVAAFVVWALYGLLPLNADE